MRRIVTLLLALSLLLTALAGCSAQAAGRASAAKENPACYDCCQ